MNDLMSMGIHRLWKRHTIELSGVRRGQRVLDLASGTGDLAERFAGIVGPQGLVVMSDINASMLTEGRERMINRGRVGNLHYALINAEKLPFPVGSFRLCHHRFRAAQRHRQARRARGDVSHPPTGRPGTHPRVLAPGQPPARARVYDLYSFSVLPTLGRLVVNDPDSYRYLAESIRMHPDQETLRAMMEAAGFERCDYFNHSGGIVAIHRGYKL
jgi:demethylmenaquinone methyltransferase / 2-methoxy-6-polyprenyl-1,4-benzoquinol methylase